MKFIIICALFAPIIYLAFRQKKWYLYLLFAFAAILPEQFSIKLHESIPLLSVTRILILIVTGFWLYDKYKTKDFHIPKSLFWFFVVNVIVSLVNLRYGTDDIKRIFLLVFERVLLVIMLMDMIHDKEEFHRCMDFAIMGCAVLSIIGIIQTVFNYDITSVLHLTKTITSIRLHDRMGLMRAFGTYNAISFGCYCSFMALLILYRLYNTKSIWQSIAFSLTFVALICTLTRSAWLCFAAVALIACVLYRTALLRRLLPSAAITLALLLVLCCLQPKLFKAFVETGKSSINTVLGVLPDSVASIFVPKDDNAIQTPEQTDPSLSSEATTETSGEMVTEPSEESDSKPSRPGFELDAEFGINANDPSYSRMAQWTAITYMIQDGELLFGYGYNALIHGRIHFFFDRWSSKWHPTTFLDVGLVALLTESGLIGTISYLGLLGYLLVYAIRKKSKDNPFDFYGLVILVIPLYLLLNYLASFLNVSIFWLFVALFYSYKRIKEKEELPEPPLQEELNP